MTSQPKQKTINCKAALFFVDNDGKSHKCGRIILKGKDGEFDKIMKKAREGCRKLVCGRTPTLTLFFNNKDDSQEKFGDEESLQGT